MHVLLPCHWHAVTQINRKERTMMSPKFGVRQQNCVLFDDGVDDVDYHHDNGAGMSMIMNH